MISGDGKGGWLWPGRGLFRVQSRAVHPSYASSYSSAPANRKDIFEGTVNVHWKSGVKLRPKPGETAYSARAGDRVVHLASNAAMTNLTAGSFVNIRAANSVKFYEQQQATGTGFPMLNMHMRAQIFTIASVDIANRTITVDKPLEYDVPVTSTSDGSAPIGGAVYDSKAAPLVDPVVGVGFEDFTFTQAMPGLDPAAATHNYGNMAPAAEMHGIVFKWAANSWVRGIRTELTGSHPIVTEEAKNLQIVDNELDGSWNKGKGGNGYFRGSRVWDSIYAGNTSRNLRHFTFQWSASGNVVIGNDFDSDLNLHGGWERNNLFELNTVRVPYAHRSGSCTANCGEEGGGGPDDSNWFPIWWGAGRKAVKWSGSSGPRNVFFNNTMTKQLATGGPFTDFYADHRRIYQFGWNGTGFQHLDVGGMPIADWARNEQRDYTGGHGVDAAKTDAAASLFLSSLTGTPPTTPSTTTTTTTTTPPSTNCLTAAFTQKSVWDSGYGGDITISNGCATATTSWTVEFDLPSGTTVSSSWNSVRTQSGQHYRFTNASHNGTIKPGATASFGFNAAGRGLPGGCTVNGVACGGGTTPPADTQAPTVPGSLRSTGVTASSVSLAWNASTDNVGVSDYEVLVGGAVATTVPSTSATLTGLSASTAYSVTVRARDAAGNRSAPTAALAVTTSPDSGGGTVVNVSTAAQLQAALATASPGQTIKLAAGTYRGSFVSQRAGTASQRITVSGPANAVLINDGPSGTAPSCPAPTAGWDSGYGLWLFDAPYWNLTGFTVAESKKGIVVDNSHHTTIDGVSVHHVDEEAVHFRRSSADSILRNSQITDTGLVQPGYGEGVYLGSANSNWACHGNSGGVDKSDRVQVLNNRIGPNIAAEPIDVKEGTFDGVIRGNTFNGQGISGQNSADSWIDVKGIGYLIEDNTGTFASPGTFANGYETHNTTTTPSFQNGCGNVWRGNRSDLGGVGQYAINITSTSKCAGNPNVVYASNTVSGAVQGLTNIPVTP
jgi:chitodextrinase